MLVINSPATYATAIEDFCETFNELGATDLCYKKDSITLTIWNFCYSACIKVCTQFQSMTVKEQNNHINLILIKLFFLKFGVLSCALFCNVGPL